jgi:hypothetical protein
MDSKKQCHRPVVQRRNSRPPLLTSIATFLTRQSKPAIHHIVVPFSPPVPEACGLRKLLRDPGITPQPWWDRWRHGFFVNIDGAGSALCDGTGL